jgi:hypothetical protein
MALLQKFLSRKFFVALAGLAAIVLGVGQEGLVAAVVAAYVAAQGLVDAAKAVAAALQNREAV